MAARKKATKKKAAKRTPARKATAKKPAKKPAARKTATKKTATRGKKKGAVAGLIISKSRTKAAVENCNVSSEFYDALDNFVRDAIAGAERRAAGNKRKTLRSQDL
jgi:hypothetical protein